MFICKILPTPQIWCPTKDASIWILKLQSPALVNAKISNKLDLATKIFLTRTNILDGHHQTKEFSWRVAETPVAWSNY